MNSGGIYFEDNATDTTGIGAASVPLLGWQSVCPSATPDPGAVGNPVAGTVTLLSAGLWLALVHVSLGGTAGVVFDFYIHRNGAELHPGAHVQTNGAGPERNASFEVLFNAVAGDVIDLRVHAETGSGRTVSPSDGSLVLLRVA